jgi:hypothetical protein
MTQATYHMKTLQQMQPKQGNGATMIKEIGTSFHYLNRGTWATHVQLASLAFMPEPSHLLCAKPPKSPLSRPLSGLWNPNHLRPLHVDDDFLGHLNGLVPTPFLLHLPNLVCNHLAISLCWHKIGTSRQAHSKPKKAGLTHVAESEACRSIFPETDKGWK